MSAYLMLMKLYETPHWDWPYIVLPPFLINYSYGIRAGQTFLSSIRSIENISNIYISK
jgi:hypothetical protein